MTETTQQQAPQQTEEEIHAEALKVIQSSLPSWQNVTLSQVRFERCSFGLSRIVYKATANVPGIPENPVIARKFFKHFHATPKELQKEQYIFELLSEKGIGPKYYGGSAEVGYRIEQYFDSRPLKCTEINDKIIRRRLALKLGAFNRLTIENIGTKTMMEKIFDDESYFKGIEENINNTSIYTPEELKQIEEMRSCTSKEEVEFVRKLIAELPQVMSHCDIWTGNLLKINQEHVDVAVVDYEMVGLAFLGYDIGKLVLETIYERSETEPSYTIREDYYPSKEDILDVIHYYLLQFKSEKVLDEETAWNYINDEAATIEQVKKLYGESQEAYEKAIHEMVNLVDIGVLISGYYSFILGLRIGKNPHFRMDFIKFAVDGYNTYKKYKKILYEN